MQVLSNAAQEPSTKSLALIFGLGMIGSSISQSLQRLGYARHPDIPYDWKNAARRAQAQQKISMLCRALAPGPCNLAVIWSAGDATFHSSDREAAEEQTIFTESVGVIQNLRESLKPVQFGFHFISSAGGLFEGQRAVDFDSAPAPLRPYGRLKLAQEEALSSSFDSRELACYRPSSVYGPMVQNPHKGLINNLINNGHHARVTVLDAHVMALRDYVFSHDIGQFVARCVRSGRLGENGRPERFLVSAKCSSIFEVVRKIQRVLNLKLRVRYDANFGNSRDITFSARTLPAGWRPVSLDVGLKQFLIGAV